MTGDESRTLSVGDRVCWQNDQADQGTVTDSRPSSDLSSCHCCRLQCTLCFPFARVARPAFSHFVAVRIFFKSGAKGEAATDGWSPRGASNLSRVHGAAPGIKELYASAKWENACP